jgi:hypothetical protein
VKRASFIDLVFVFVNYAIRRFQPIGVPFFQIVGIINQSNTANFLQTGDSVLVIQRSANISRLDAGLIMSNGIALLSEA